MNSLEILNKFTRIHKEDSRWLYSYVTGELWCELMPVETTKYQSGRLTFDNIRDNLNNLQMFICLLKLRIERDVYLDESESEDICLRISKSINPYLQLKEGSTGYIITDNPLRCNNRDIPRDIMYFFQKISPYNYICGQMMHVQDSMWGWDYSYPVYIRRVQGSVHVYTVTGGISNMDDRRMTDFKKLISPDFRIGLDAILNEEVILQECSLLDWDSLPMNNITLTDASILARHIAVYHKDIGYVQLGLEL